MNVIFVKWGTKYSIDDVNRLFESLYKYRPDFNYYCYTEIPGDSKKDIDSRITIIDIPFKPALKKWWNKLRMFSPEFPLAGKTIYFDLDIMINSDPFGILDSVDWDKLTLINCHWKSGKIYDRATNYDVRINSSVITWTAGNSDIHQLWNHFYLGGLKDYYLRKYVGIDRFIVHEEFEYNTFPSEFIHSYKYELDKIAPITTFEEVHDKFAIVSRSEDD